MRKRKLIHPRKVVWVMRDFINEIHGFTYEDIVMPDASLPVNEWFEQFTNAEHITRRTECNIVKARGFCAFTGDFSEGDDEFTIGYNFDNLWNRGHYQFSKDFFERCPSARGFASVTISLLHELGHFTAQQEFEGYDRGRALAELREKFPPATINFEYFKLPDEKTATDWAINWLSDPEHRKIAKAFEKKFFACFA